jgi:SAM-dependent methyltransferase
MLDAAKVISGSRVLDVATGAGYIAAEAEGRGAIVSGIDFSTAQVNLAKKTYPSIDFQQGDADELNFGEDSIDAVVIGFGVNHFPDPERVFAEVYRVLKAGGIFAYTVWASPEQNPGFSIILSAIEEFGNAANNLPPAPPYFRFANAEESRDTLSDIGFREPRTLIVPQYWNHQSPDMVFDAFYYGAVRATAMLRAQSLPVQKQIKAKARNEVLQYHKNDRFMIPVPAALSYATK